MVMLFQLMVECDHETFWLFQFFLQKMVRSRPELRATPFPKLPLEVGQVLAVPGTSSMKQPSGFPGIPGRQCQHQCSAL